MHILSLSRDLPFECDAVTTASQAARPEAPLRGIRAVTFDFGNTLVRVGRGALQAVVERTAMEATDTLGLGHAEAFRAAWVEERDRQFREELPAFREVDLEQRAVRVVARLRGMSPPRQEIRWDDAAAARLASPAEIEVIVEAYSRTFIELVPPVEGATDVMSELATRGFSLAILSNWPLATTVDRYAAAAGWDRHLAAIFVSQRIGTIKPHPAIFAFAAGALSRAPGEILHVGDDWAADVAGAHAAGWRTAYLREHQSDTPLPTSARTADVVPDVELDQLAELPSRIADPTS